MGNPPARPGSFRRILPLLFFMSGFSSLLLEVTWARQLTQMTGSGVRASGTVAAVMLAGLALGALVGGRLADRLLQPLRAYAFAEIGIALCALLTVPLATWLARLTALIQPGVSQELDLAWRSLLVSAILVLPGSLLMGATTPLVVRADFSAAPPAEGHHSSGRSLGRVYGWNTLGGSAGALGAAFAILPGVGLRTTTHLAAGMDLAVAGLALSLPLAGNLQKPGSLTAAPRVARMAVPHGGASPRATILIALFLAGALAAICQVAWTRLLVLFFGSSVQALGLTLAACLGGLALGSGWCARALRKEHPPALLTVRLSGVTAALTLLTLPVWGILPVMAALAQARLGASFVGALALQSFFCALLILPIALAFGALLPALTAALGGGDKTTGRTAGRSYALDSGGSVFGGLSAAFLLLPFLGVEDLLRWAVVAEAALFILLALSSRPRNRRGGVVRVASLSGILLCFAALLPSWDPVLLTSGPLLYSTAYVRAGGLSWKGVREAMRHRGKLIFLDEGPDATVTVRRTAAGDLSLQINGKTDASDGGDLPSQILAGEIPALLHAAPSRALIIGLASGTTAGSVAGHPVRRLECVEISTGVARAARFFESANGGVLSEPRFHLLRGDGRVYLQQTRESFDLIVSQPTNPWVAGVTNLFTQEFFQTARERLAVGGILAVWVQGYAIHPDDFRSIVGTFLQIFPDGELWEESAGGGDYFLLGWRDGTRPTLRDLAGRMQASPSARARLARAGVGDLPDFLERFIASGKALERFSRGAPRITDDNLRLEYSAPREIWENRLPELLSSLETARQSPATIFPDLLEPFQEALRASLAERERGRQDRMRLALSVRREDLEALASPSLAAAVRLIRKGAFEEALPFLRRARQEAPRAPVVPLLLGWILLSSGRVQEAEPVFREVLALDSRSAGATMGLGLSLYRQTKIAEAAEALQEAVSLDPGDPDPLANLGAAFVAQGHYQEALAPLDRALAMDPGHLSARINRGVALARLGRVQEAIQDYERALALDPQSEDARYNLQRARERLRVGAPSTP